MDTPATDAQDQADMARLVQGHDPALNSLMDRHAPALFHFLCRMLGNESDAADLAQETFVRVYHARDTFKPGQKFSAWLFTIAANLARNQLRWRSRHPNLSLDAESDAPGQTLGDALPDSSPTPGQSAEAAERAQAVRAAVQTLPEDMRQAVVLCEWQDLPVAEAATLLQSTTKAVESRLYRARQILREKLRAWL